MAEKSLEELLLETEQRILNNDFYKSFIVSYEGEEYKFYLKPISQRRFMQLFTQYGQGGILNMSEELIYECLVLEDGTPYKKELIDILVDKMPAGFTTDIAMHIFEVSGIPISNQGYSPEEIERFLKGASQL